MIRRRENKKRRSKPWKAQRSYMFHIRSNSSDIILFPIEFLDTWIRNKYAQRGCRQPREVKLTCSMDKIGYYLSNIVMLSNHSDFYSQWTIIKKWFFKKKLNFAEPTRAEIFNAYSSISMYCRVFELLLQMWNMIFNLPVVCFCSFLDANFFFWSLKTEKQLMDII